MTMIISSQKYFYCWAQLSYCSHRHACLKSKESAYACIYLYLLLLALFSSLDLLLQVDQGNPSGMWSLQTICQDEVSTKPFTRIVTVYFHVCIW